MPSAPMTFGAQTKFIRRTTTRVAAAYRGMHGDATRRV